MFREFRADATRSREQGDLTRGNGCGFQGMLFSFWVAFMSKRAFFIKYTRPAQLQEAFVLAAWWSVPMVCAAG